MKTQFDNDAMSGDDLSLLVDGRLRGAEFARVVDALNRDGEARATWHAYHVVGEVLRGQASSTGSDAAFLARFREHLAADESVGIRPVVVSVDAPSAVGEMTTAANESVFRWKLVAGLASVVAVSALAWSTISGIGGSGAAPQVAQAPQSVSSPVQVAERAGVPPVMIRDARLDELLAAHKQTAGGGSALHMSSGFLRNATFEGAAR